MSAPIGSLHINEYTENYGFTLRTTLLDCKKSSL